eukprot:CAMPEP_0176489178 /NCGR_PEP_ID=MMETSP0200_2-20121128/7138_1 /TAXON_ID=947934 /ORGANISM="Chaetoceros sp., Strain GSL56" /LENGTH=149 /DNA_ID=CAMNT_0017886279 /DNA_START=346 /DNA_END=792 /DNA_ORIENTATION=-
MKFFTVASCIALSFVPSVIACGDDLDFTFDRFNGLPGNCTWLAEKEVRQTKFCGRGNVKGACQATCNFCSCEDTKPYSFNRPDNNVPRDCPWIADESKPIRKRFCYEGSEIVSGAATSEAGNNCVRSCGFCTGGTVTKPPTKAPTKAPT